MCSPPRFPFDLVISLLSTSLWFWLGMSLEMPFPLPGLLWSLVLPILIFVFLSILSLRSPVIWFCCPIDLLTPIVLKSLLPCSVHSIDPLCGVLCPFFDLDRQVLDLNWKIAHGVLYTAERLSSFGLPVPLPCFCGAPVGSLSHLFYACPLARSVLSWLQLLMFFFSPMSPVLLVRHSLFGLNPDELHAPPRVFVYILIVCKFSIWRSRNDFCFRSVQPGTLPVIECVKARVKFNLPLFCKHFKSSCRHRFFSSMGCLWCYSFCYCWSTVTQYLSFSLY